MDPTPMSIGWMFAFGVFLHTIFKWSRWAKPGKASPVAWLKATAPDLIGGFAVNAVIVFAYLAGFLPMAIAHLRASWFPTYSEAIDVPLTTFAAVPVGWLSDSVGRGLASMLDWRRAPAGGE